MASAFRAPMVGEHFNPDKSELMIEYLWMSLQSTILQYFLHG